MAIAIKFDKGRASYYLDCLSAGKPISPSGDGWTGNDMLALAGACFFAAQSQGPASFWLTEIPESLHTEHRELVDETFSNDVHAAIKFYGFLTMCVQDGDYDERCEPEASALVALEGEVRWALTPIKGFKGYVDQC